MESEFVDVNARVAEIVGHSRLDPVCGLTRF